MAITTRPSIHADPSTSVAISTPSPIHSQPALFWITPPEKTSDASSSCWYLGGKDVTSWAESMGKGLSSEKQTALLKKVNWVIKATLATLETLRRGMPKDPKHVATAPVCYEGEVHNLSAIPAGSFFGVSKLVLS